MVQELRLGHPVLYNNGMEVAGHVALRFTEGAGADAPVNLTAVCAQGAHLWVAGDETAALGRLVLDSTASPTRAGRQRGFRLADLVQLPGPANGEADLKGIACTDGWLWAIGSHALVRRRPKPEHDDQKVVRRLGKLRRDPNRYIIARLAVQLGVDRRPEPVRVSRDGRRSALIGAPGAESLVDLLRADAHLAPFLGIPGQDNGFEVQGLAAVGDRLYVGLRGPVLRGWAVVLEVRPAQDPTDPGRLALGIFPEGARYRKHMLDLGGLGVRGLSRDGDDLLVLAGPAMAVPGPVRVHRWTGAAAAATGPVVRAADLPVEAVVPHGDDDDRPAGMALLAPNPHDPRARLLVVHDGPATARLPWPGTVLADRVRIGSSPAERPVDEPAVDVPADDDPAAGTGVSSADDTLSEAGDVFGTEDTGRQDASTEDTGTADTGPESTEAGSEGERTEDLARATVRDELPAHTGVTDEAPADAGVADEHADRAGVAGEHTAHAGVTDGGPADAGTTAEHHADEDVADEDSADDPDHPDEDPAQVHPAHGDHARVGSATVDPAPVDPAPVDATPVDAAPVDAAPVDAAPVDAAPVDATPVDPADGTRARGPRRPSGHLAADLLHVPAALRTWGDPAH